MFSRAVSVGTRLNGWKTNPRRSRRSRVSALSESAVQLDVADAHRARASPVEAGEAVHQRRLAGPRRAHDRGELARGQAQARPVEGTDGVSPLPYTFMRSSTRPRHVAPGRSGRGCEYDRHASS